MMSSSGIGCFPVGIFPVAPEIGDDLVAILHLAHDLELRRVMLDDFPQKEPVGFVVVRDQDIVLSS